MSAPLNLETRHFPSRIADLGFTTRLPADWVGHQLPPEGPDLSQPTEFFPLAIVTAPHAAIVLAVAARPAHGDGTLNDWAWYHLNHGQFKPRAVGADQVAGVPAVVGEATQESELGTMVVRFAFLEDGDRLINLSFSAPEILADAVRDVWFASLQSFTLETPKGSRFSAGVPIPSPTADPATPEARPSSVVDAAAPAPERPSVLANFAFAADSAALDPEAEINVNLRSRGAGLVPNVLSTDDEHRYATVAAGAVMAIFDVPYGWHVIDDGKRTLMLDPGGKVQINLSLLPREGRANGGVLDDIEASTRADYPAPEFCRMSSGKIEALGVRNIADGSEAIEQYHFLMDFRDESLVVRARITATPDKASFACTLGELVLNSFRFAMERPLATV